MITPNVMRILQDRQLSMDQKIMAFMMFTPDLPNEDKYDHIHEANDTFGRIIKKLVDDKKIVLGTFDKNFVLDAKAV